MDDLSVDLRSQVLLVSNQEPFSPQARRVCLIPGTSDFLLRGPCSQTTQPKVGRDEAKHDLPTHARPIHRLPGRGTCQAYRRGQQSLAEGAGKMRLAAPSAEGAKAQSLSRSQYPASLQQPLLHLKLCK